MAPSYRSPGKISWLKGIVAMVRARDPEEQDGVSRSTNSKLTKFRMRNSFLQQLWLEFRKFFLGTKLNVLLLTIPVATASKLAGWGDGPTCVLSMIGLIPLAERLGYVTEELASYTNDSIGGLLNATFGNATELIISAFAIQSVQLRVVQLSLLGSVVSNLLLVMGTAFMVGGISHPMQAFNREGVSVHCGLLLLAAIAVLLPTMLVMTRTESYAGDPPVGQDIYPTGSSSLILSRIESVMLLACYALFLVFQLCTHKHLYEGPDDSVADGSVAAAGNGRRTDIELAEIGASGAPDRDVVEREKERERTLSGRDRRTTQCTSRTTSGRPLNRRVDAEIDEATVPLVAGTGTMHSSGAQDAGHPGTDVIVVGPALGAGSREAADLDDSESPDLSMPGCFLWMSLVTVAIAFLSAWIVSAIEGASRELGVPLPFLVTILLPIVGNAAEHASAVVFAVRNKMDLALGVAVGSATQVSVLLVPVCVVLAWAMGRPLDLDLSAFESAVFFVSVLLAIVVLQDGSSNWLKGVLLILTYVFVAAGFWCHQDETLAKEEARNRLMAGTE